MSHEKQANIYLKSERIISTISLLHSRVEERFPKSGLFKVCTSLQSLAKQAEERAAWIDKPNHLIRIGTKLTIFLALSGLFWLLYHLKLSGRILTLSEFLPLSEAALNVGLVLAGALIFLLSLEARVKRKRALEALHELRSLAHVVDMHQLTKEPGRLSQNAILTRSSPRIDLSAYELSRYLDYCSEMLSLIGKVSALYAQTLNDEVVLSTVNDIESLTTSLSNKIWQKNMIVHKLIDKKQIA